MHEKRSADESRRLLWPLLLAAAVTWCSAGQAPEVGGEIPHLDKIVHFAVYALLATLIARVPAVQRTRPLGIYAAVLIVSVFGITDEVHQFFTPGRSMDLFDWVADTAGALTGTILYAEWLAYRRMLETPVRELVGKRRVEIEEEPCVIAADGLR